MLGRFVGEGWEGKEWSEWVGGSIVRRKRGKEMVVGGKGWEISTHILRYLLKNVDN